MSINFTIRQFPPKTIIWWYKKRMQIDFDPSYQRKSRLWSNADKAFLIDSILNGYDIPKIYIADFTFKDTGLNIKRLPYAIVDGKQRFEAIIDFIEGKICLNDDFVYLPDPTLKMGGYSYRKLKEKHEDVADDFDNYSLTIMSIIATNSETINDLFVRLNRSKPLSGAEIRSAISGPASELIKQIGGHDFFINNIRFSIKRSQNYNAAAKLLMFEYYKEIRETSRAQLDRFVEQEIGTMKNEKVELAGWYVIDMLDDMAEIFLPKDKLLTSSGIIPVYYWFIRAIQKGQYPYVRDFLLWFKKQREQHNEIIKHGKKHVKINNTFIKFDSYKSRTNTKEGHNERFIILNNCFKNYLKTVVSG